MKITAVFVILFAFVLAANVAADQNGNVIEEYTTQKTIFSRNSMNSFIISTGGELDFPVNCVFYNKPRDRTAVIKDFSKIVDIDFLYRPADLYAFGVYGTFGMPGDNPLADLYLLEYGAKFRLIPISIRLDGTKCSNCADEQEFNAFMDILFGASTLFGNLNLGVNEISGTSPEFGAAIGINYSFLELSLGFKTFKIENDIIRFEYSACSLILNVIFQF